MLRSLKHERITGQVCPDPRAQPHLSTRAAISEAAPAHDSAATSPIGGPSSLHSWLPSGPQVNAMCERFVRTFKEEEVLIRDYADIADAVRSMRRYLEVTYNQRRLHSALGYRAPAEFEGLYSRSPMSTYPSLTLCIKNGVHNRTQP